MLELIHPFYHIWFPIIVVLVTLMIGTIALDVIRTNQNKRRNR